MCQENKLRSREAAGGGSVREDLAEEVMIEMDPARRLGLGREERRQVILGRIESQS